MGTVKPNKYQVAVKELPTNTGTYEMPQEIDAKAAKNHYWLVCIKATDAKNGMDKIYSFKTRVISINQFNKMQRQVDKGIFKQLFGDIFNKVIVLHNPTLKAAPVKKEVKGLSPTHKSEAKKLKEEGQSNEDIAEALGLELERVNAYFA